MKLGDRIRDLRWDARLTQTELARRVGIHKNSMSEIERGVSTPKAETLKRIADALGVTMDSIYEESELVGKASAPEKGGPALLEQTAFLIREQDRLDAEAAARAVETGKPQADFAHAENRATALALAAEHSELAGEFVRAVRVIEELRKERAQQTDPARFFEAFDKVLAGSGLKQTTLS
jgi:transcriptional regulator with XRE-family HTH domain